MKVLNKSDTTSSAAPRHRRTALPGVVVIVASMALSLTGCTSSGNTAVAARRRQQTDSINGVLGINSIANETQLAIIGRVVEIKPPVTFKYTVPHDAQSKPITVPQTTQDVVVAVEQVKFANPSISVTPGQTVTITLKPAPEDFKTPCGQVIKASDYNGSLVVGQESFLLLQYFPAAPGPNGLRPVWLEVFAWASVWTVNGTQAKNIDALRTVPLDSLVQRLQTERQAGRHPERDAGTEENPLAQPGSQPSATPGCQVSGQPGT
jgi:hypothetical protein